MGALAFPAQAGEALSTSKSLRIGVTLHPYYSWVSNIAVGTDTTVVAVLSESSDPHAYQPLPEDIEQLATLDALVINGLGHDEFIPPMLKAAGDKSPEIIRPNSGVPLLASRLVGSDTPTSNSHTFLSITSAVQQVANIACKAAPCPVSSGIDAFLRSLGG